MGALILMLMAGAVYPIAGAALTQERIEEEVRGAFKRYVEALANCDTKTAESLRHSEWSHVAPSGRLTTAADLQPRSDCKPYKPAQHDDLRVRVYGGDTAVVTGRITISPPGRAPLAPARFTSVWIKGTNGTWQNVAYQGTEIRQAAP